MRAEYLPHAMSAFLLAACGGTPAARDLGVDLGQDAGQDAGPPYLPFEPRLLFSDPGVRCEAPPPLEMSAVSGPRPARGTVRWTYRPALDPVALGALTSFGAVGLQFYGAFTGMSDGRFIAPINGYGYYLGVTPEGAFDFLIGANSSKYGPVWLMPHMFINRPSNERLGLTLEFHDIPGRGASGVGRIAYVHPELLISLPGSASLAETAGPAVLADGTVVWTPTNRTLMAVCGDGRPRWVLEYYNTGYGGQVFAAGDGSIVLWGGQVSVDLSAGVVRNDAYRIDSDGNVLTHHEGRLDNVLMPSGGGLGYSDRCGLVSNHYRDGVPGVEYESGADFSVVRELPGSQYPTNDCGGWAASPPEYVYRRYRADGALGFEYRGPRRPTLGSHGPIELADGSWLFVSKGPPGMTIVGDDGSVLFDRDFDPAVVGEELTTDAFLLTPDGVLYVAANSALESVQQISAIEIGVGRAPSWIGIGTNWARDNATWHAPP